MIEEGMLERPKERREAEVIEQVSSATPVPERIKSDTRKSEVSEPELDPFLKECLDIARKKPAPREEAEFEEQPETTENTETKPTEKESTAMPEAPPIMSGGLFEQLDENMRLAHPWPPALYKEHEAGTENNSCEHIRERLHELREEGITAVAQRKANDEARIVKEELCLVKDLVDGMAAHAGVTIATEEKTLDGLVKTEEAKADVEEKKECMYSDAGKTMSGNYTITKKVGEGAFKILYEARSDATGRKKILATANGGEGTLEEKNKQLLAEVEVNKLLDHAHIMPIEAVFHDDEGKAYLVLPFVKGAKRADLQEKTSPKRVAELGTMVADAYAHAHSKGIIHRDIKAENVLIDDEGKAYVIDFGVAKLNEKTAEQLRSSLTGTSFVEKNIAGTATHMDPEVLFGYKEADAQSDIYSLGVLLYQMILQSSKTVPIGNVENKLAPIAGQKLASIIARCVAERETRYPAMTDVANELKTVSKELPDLETIAQKSAEVKEKETKAEKNVPEKPQTAYLPRQYWLFANIRRSMGDIPTDEFLMLASQFMTDLRTTLSSFSRTLILKKNCPMFLNKAKTRQTPSLRDAVDQVLYSTNCSQEDNELIDLVGIKIGFESDDKKISGSVVYGLRSGPPFFTHAEFFATIIGTKESDDDPLYTKLKQLTAEYTRKQWFSKKKQLEKDGFTLEYALDLFETGKFKELPAYKIVRFEKRAYREEGQGNKALLTYDASLDRIKKEGLSRHARPQEVFGLIIDCLEDKVVDGTLRSVRDDMFAGYGEWLSCAFERQGNKLIVYLDPEGVSWDGSKYVKTENFKFGGIKEFDITWINSVCWTDVNKFGEEFIQHMYGKKFSELPAVMKTGGKRAQVYLPPDQTFWPVARGDFVNFYDVYACNVDGRASRGVTVGAKKSSIRNEG